MLRGDRRSACPVNYALQVFGDTWTLLVVRDVMLFGKKTYTEFLRSGEGISTNILADRLRRLIREGILCKTGRGKQAEYTLTPKGVDLVRVVLAMVEWGATYDEGTATPPSMLARMRADREGIIADLRNRLLGKAASE